MTYKDFFKENNMSQVSVGGMASISGQTGTYASPDVTQNPGSFPADSSKVNIVPPVDQDVKSKIDPEQYKKDVDVVKQKVSPDDIIQGMEYEMKKQIYKNKMSAKEAVIKNLKVNPRHYRDLDMLTGGADMMNENSDQNQAINQILKDLQDQSKSKERTQQKYGDFDAIKKLMEEKWEEKKKKRHYGF
jgi:hypothetical protein